MTATTTQRAASDDAPASTVRSEIVDPRAWGDVSDWDRAVAAMAAPSVFLTRAWVQAWWRHVGMGSRRPALVRVSDDGGQTLGLAPFTIERRGPGGRVRRLGLAGDELVGSEYLGPVALAGQEEIVARAAVDCLREAAVGWDVARLAGIRPDDPAGVALARSVVSGAGRHDSRAEPGAAIELPRDPDAWMATLGSSFRRRLRQRRRRLERDHRVRYLMAGDHGEVRLALDRLFALHQARWRARRRPGSFADRRMRSFYRELAPAFLNAGRLRLWVLQVDGVARAVQFGFVHDGVLHSLQEAYDSEWGGPGVGGLGVVLRFHVVAAAIGEGLRRYDFLGGNEEHKRRWGTSLRSVQEIRVAAAGPRGRAAWAATFGARDARDRVAVRLPVVLKERLRPR